MDRIRIGFLRDVLAACGNRDPRALALIDKWANEAQFRDATPDEIEECNAVLDAITEGAQ